MVTAQILFTEMIYRVLEKHLLECIPPLKAK